MNAPSAPSDPAPPTNVKPFAAAVAVRMADEGIPIRAIARATRMPSSEIYKALEDAISLGIIFELPKDDWPPGSSRGSRAPEFPDILHSEEAFRFACSRCFKLTRQEAEVFSVLLRRVEASKGQVHAAIEAGREHNKKDQPTEPKIVDVVICKLRKKVKPHGIEIMTSWGNGYFISAPHRAVGTTILSGFLEGEAAQTAEAA